MYNTGGDMISGKWINKNDGSIISIRNTVMDGDNIILITDKGELDMNSFSKNYIQVLIFPQLLHNSYQYPPSKIFHTVHILY